MLATMIFLSRGEEVTSEEPEMVPGTVITRGRGLGVEEGEMSKMSQVDTSRKFAQDLVTCRQEAKKLVSCSNTLQNAVVLQSWPSFLDF